MEIKNKKEWRTLYTMLIIVGIAMIGFLGLMLIMESADAQSICFVDDDGVVGKTTETSGYDRYWIQTLKALDVDYTVYDCGNYRGDPDFDPATVAQQYDALFWVGFYSIDYNYYGGQKMAQTMREFFKQGKTVVWGSVYNHYWYKQNHLESASDGFSLRKGSSGDTEFCYWGWGGKVWGIQTQEVLDLIDTSDYPTVTNKANLGRGPGRYYGFVAKPYGTAKTFMKSDGSFSYYYNKVAGTVYYNDNPPSGYSEYYAIQMGNQFSCIPDANVRKVIMKSILELIAAKDEEGEGEMESPKDNQWIQKMGDWGYIGDNNVTLEWKFVDSNYDPEADAGYQNLMKYHLYLSMQMSDITTMANELKMAKYINQSTGEPMEQEDGGVLNSDWSKDPTEYDGYLTTIDDPYTNIDEDGYSHIIYTINGIEDGTWYWGVLAEEKDSPTTQRFRTPLTGSGYVRSFHIDTISPDVVISECNPKISSIGEWSDIEDRVCEEPYEITIENSDEIPSSTTPLKLVVKDTISYGTTSDIDIERTMNTFDFEIDIPGVGKLNSEDWNALCEDIKITHVPKDAKVIFEWYLKDENHALLFGEIPASFYVVFKLRFLVYDNNGNVLLPNNAVDPGQTDEQGHYINEWMIYFRIDITPPKAPLMPSVNFFKVTDVETNYVWLGGDKKYNLSTYGPTSLIDKSSPWYDETMEGKNAGVEFGRIKEGKDYVDWEGGDKIGFMSVDEAYQYYLSGKSDSPAYYYIDYIEFTPEKDDIAYVARAVDKGGNTNESESLEGWTDEKGVFKEFVVDIDGPGKPSLVDIKGEDIDPASGTIKVKGEVKDKPVVKGENKGVGIDKVEIIVEDKDGNKMTPYPTAKRGDFITEEGGTTKLNTAGQFEVREIALWPGINLIYARAYDLLGNKGELSDPQKIINIYSGIKDEELTMPGSDDLRIKFLQLPQDKYFWMNVERKKDPTTLPKFPKDATIGTATHEYWHIETNLKLEDTFIAEIKIDYGKYAGIAQGVEEKDLIVIANSGEEGAWETVSDPALPPEDGVYTIIVEHFTDFVIVGLDPRPYAHIDEVLLDHTPIIAGQKLKIKAKLVNVGRFTSDSGSKEHPIEVSFDARNKETGETIYIGTRELEGGVLKAGETEAYVEISWVVPAKGEYEITAQLDPNGTADNPPGYSIESVTIQSIVAERVTTSFTTTFAIVAIAISIVAVFSQIKRKLR